MGGHHSRSALPTIFARKIPAILSGRLSASPQLLARPPVRCAHQKDLQRKGRFCFMSRERAVFADPSSCRLGHFTSVATLQFVFSIYVLPNSACIGLPGVAVSDWKPGRFRARMKGDREARLFRRVHLSMYRCMCLALSYSRYVKVSMRASHPARRTCLHYADQPLLNLIYTTAELGYGMQYFGQLPSGLKGVSAVLMKTPISAHLASPVLLPQAVATQPASNGQTDWTARAFWSAQFCMWRPFRLGQSSDSGVCDRGQPVGTPEGN